jgi:hypothetical protein
VPDGPRAAQPASSPVAAALRDRISWSKGMTSEAESATLWIAEFRSFI